ncbi:hypothetical protein [Armatimonas sp.]|uniref:hypothetical protein n=1 Tax=Armatimonas sp. TaxID=1872638 RepID=UPI0037529379
MKRTKKITLFLLGIVASAGCASLIVTPSQESQVALPEEYLRRLRVPLPKQEDEFSRDVYLYHISGALPSHSLQFRCGFGLTEKQIQADQQALKERDARVIAEAKRQEAREAVL